MATLILFFSSLHISTAIGYYSTEYIIGGYHADIQDFPYHVSLQIYATKHGCGGSVITEKFIITAGHCVCNLPFPVNQLNIFMGSTKLSGKGQIHHVEHAECHKDFNPTNRANDIGMIGVKDTIIFSKLVRPISIVSGNIPAGTRLTMSGWGFMSFPKNDTTDDLRMLEVHVISREKCMEELHMSISSQICTFNKLNKGACLGDSGGPLTFNGALVGVVSWGKPCAQGLPDVNTKVSDYIKWIKTTITRYCKTRNCPSAKWYPKFVKNNKRNRSNKISCFRRS